MTLTINIRNLSLSTKLGNRLIKFRYGAQRNQQNAAGHQQPQVSDLRTSSQRTQQGSNEAIWDFQLPARWKRAPISEEECAVINNGGPL